MAAAQVTAEGAYALSLAIVVAMIYLALVRFMDLNEKEPLWAVGLIFLLGAVTATVLPLLVGYAVLELNLLLGAVSEEVAKFVAFFIGVVVLGAVARSRGLSEMSGLMDCIVYGTALGLGFATGEAFVRELAFGGALGGAIDAGPFATLWTTALVGLSDGLFGAAAGARPMAQEIGFPLAGLVGAILAHLALSQQQYDALGSIGGRMGSAFRSLSSGGFGGWRANARFSQAATELAFHRDRVQRGITSVDAASRESAYVQTLRELRART